MIFPVGPSVALEEREAWTAGRGVHSAGARTLPTLNWDTAFKVFGADYINWTQAAIGGGIVSLTQAWRSSPWLRVTNALIAGALADRELRLYRKREPIKSHWLLDLIARPNQLLRLSEYELKLQSFSIYDLFGECFWILGREGSKTLQRKLRAPVTDLWVYHPHAMTEAYNEASGELLGWYANYEGRNFFVDRNDVIHFKNFDPTRFLAGGDFTHRVPSRPTRGTALVESKMLAISTDIAASKWNLDFFARGIAPNIVLMNKGAISETKEGEFVDKLRAKVAGKNGEPLVLTEGEWTVAQLAAAQRDAEFTTGKDKAREEIIAGRVPPVWLGKDDASYANADIQVRVWWTTTGKPMGRSWCGSLDAALLADEGDFSSELSTHDVEELQKPKLERVKAAVEFVNARGTWAAADEIFDLGLPNFAGKDQVFVQYTMVPLEDALAQQAVDDKPQKPADKPQIAPGEPPVAPPGGVEGEIKPRLSIEAATRSLTLLFPTRAASEIDDALSVVLEIIRGDDVDLQKLARQFHIQALETGEKQIGDLLGIDTVVPIDDQRVIDFLAEKANQIVSVNETTADRIMETIRALVGESATPEDIGRDIRDLYNLRSEQSKLIARQEVGSALNGGRYIQLGEDDISTHEWLTSRDNRVRESHAAIDGEMVSVGDRFSNGLEYPQDPMGDPSEVINCRCITLPVTNDRERIARMRTRVLDKDQYWRAAVVDNPRTIERAFTAKLSRYFNDGAKSQRGRVLKALSERGIIA